MTYFIVRMKDVARGAVFDWWDGILLRCFNGTSDFTPNRTRTEVVYHATLEFNPPVFDKDDISSASR